VNLFFGTPIKLVFLAVLAGLIVVSVTANPPVMAEDRSAIMSIDRGGVEFFKEISPSIVQVYHGGYITGGGWSGSGYVIDRGGYLITNRHVTLGEPVFEVAFYGDENSVRTYAEGRWKGTLIGQDPTLDLGIVKVDAPPEKFHPVRLADSALMQPGDTVATFGSPGGDPNNPNRGLVGYEQNWLEYYNLNLGVVAEVLSFEDAFWVFQWMGTEAYDKGGVRDYGAGVEYLFRVDSAINSGNSGGPALNIYGEAIGTNTWGGGGGENVGMSVPVNLLKRSVASIIEYGRPRHPWLGISLHPPHRIWEMYERAYAPNVQGYLEELVSPPVGFDSEPDQLKVITVNPYSPAYNAGLREGDIVKMVDGEVYRNIFDIYSHVLAKEIGDTIRIDYERDGHGMPALDITLEERKTRFFGNEALVYGWGGAAGFGWYTSDLTY
jgi:S1-C subfamily serine protease